MRYAFPNRKGGTSKVRARKTEAEKQCRIDTRVVNLRKVASRIAWETGLAKNTTGNEFEYWVATLQPTLRQYRWAFGVVVVMLVTYGVTLPFSGTLLPQFDSFVPTVMAIVFVTDLITAVLLFGQFSATGSRPLLILASGYLFSSLIALPYTLTFPGAFSPTGLLGAGFQSAPWLSVSSRSGLALAIVDMLSCPLTGARKVRSHLHDGLRFSGAWR